MLPPANGSRNACCCFGCCFGGTVFQCFTRFTFFAQSFFLGNSAHFFWARKNGRREGEEARGINRESAATTGLIALHFYTHTYSLDFLKLWKRGKEGGGEEGRCDQLPASFYLRIYSSILLAIARLLACLNTVMRNRLFLHCLRRRRAAPRMCCKAAT